MSKSKSSDEASKNSSVVENVFTCEDTITAVSGNFVRGLSIEGNAASNIRPPFDINLLYLRWRQKEERRRLSGGFSLTREYRSIYITQEDFDNFVVGNIQTCWIEALGGGYYNVSWGLYRDVERNETFVYYISVDFERIHEMNYGITDFDFVPKSIEEISEDSGR